MFRDSYVTIQLYDFDHELYHVTVVNLGDWSRSQPLIEPSHFDRLSDRNFLLNMQLLASDSLFHFHPAPRHFYHA